MSEYVSKKQRIQVAQRAGYRCEYCLMPERLSWFTFHINHVVSIKHGGLTTEDNLAYCCGTCNGNKGTDLGTFLTDFLQIVRFFNPRIDKWHDHFELIEGMIHAKSDIAEATIKIFRFNELERILERKLLQEGGFLVD
jgi:5-methylcytosine-specific restriction endonuclease McrA